MIKTLAERFWAKVQCGSNDECWPWLGCVDKDGYGVSWTHKKRPAHQVAWEIETGQLWPKGLQSRHTCDNPPCVNPQHIIPGTISENTLDQVERGKHNHARKTHCKHGHEFTVKNTWINKKTGNRMCRACNNIRQKQTKQRAKQKCVTNNII
jgi:hypothetical protein